MSIDDTEAEASDMTHTFRGRTVLITGAASGIGLATLEKLYLLGADLIAVDADRRVSSIVEGVRSRHPISCLQQRLVAVRADVADPHAIEAVLDSELGTEHELHAVVHSAAISVGGTAVSTSFEDWQHVLDVNLSAAFTIAKATVPRLARTSGSLVLVASQLGLVGAKGSVAYAASKGGVINLMRSLALDHGPEGVRVNCLCPGPTDTPFLQQSFERADDPAEARRRALEKIPLGRFGTSEEIANAAVFLASTEASFVHGAALVVDGGYVAA
jgi:meso-butanediol dehydrogenase/(S,S)-butanediol dehydrogenase/diacetyl reductase